MIVAIRVRQLPSDGAYESVRLVEVVTINEFDERRPVREAARLGRLGATAAGTSWQGMARDA